jgi:hypothetical protein
MASDAPSLARWWRASCAGEIVSQASLTNRGTSAERPTPQLRLLGGGDAGHDPSTLEQHVSPSPVRPSVRAVRSAALVCVPRQSAPDDRGSQSRSPCFRCFSGHLSPSGGPSAWMFARRSSHKESRDLRRFSWS